MALLDLVGIDGPPEAEGSAITNGLLQFAQAGRRRPWLGILQGLAAADGTMQAAKDKQRAIESAALKDRLALAQIAEVEAQGKLRTAQAEKVAGLMDQLRNWAAPGAAPAGGGGFPGAPGEPAIVPAAGGPAGGSPGANPLFGIPPQAIQADLAFNDGKGIAAMLEKRGAPNMAVHNGIAVDMNRLPAGATFPTISQNGQASIPIADPAAPGGYRIAAPPGSVETYAAFRAADEAAKAGADAVKVWNPAQQRYEFQPRSAVLAAAGGGTPPGGSGPAVVLPGAAPAGAQSLRDAMRVPADVQAQRDEESRRVIAREIETETNPQVRDALRRELSRVAGGGAPAAPAGARQSGAMAAEPSTREAATSTYDTEVQKDMAARRKAILDAADLAGSKIANLRQVGSLLADHDGGKFSDTGLELARGFNSFGIKIDPMLGNKEAAVALQSALTRDAVGGSLGPGVSNSDVQLMQKMVPRLDMSSAGRKTLIDIMTAVEERKQEVARFARRYESKNGRLDGTFFEQLSAWSDANPLFGEQSAKGR